MRIHLLGPSGSGTSTLGKALAEALGIPWFDSDSVYWEASDPPFTKKRPLEERVALLKRIDAQNDSWVLSGSMLQWGDFLRARMDLIIYLFVDRCTRIERLRKREKERFGARIEKGNDMYENHEAFIAWAESYEDGGLDTRSRKSETAWIAAAECEVLRIETEMTVREGMDIAMRSEALVRFKASRSPAKG